MRDEEKAVVGVAIALAVLMGAIKVSNELRMTAMYERQAVALEAIAGSLGDKDGYTRKGAWVSVTGFK